MDTPTQTVTHDIVAKLWNLCNVLKDDGVTYHQYVTELTFLLFLKMAKETGTESQLPEGYRWDDLERKPAPERLEFYRHLLIHLGAHGSLMVRQIFANASSFVKKPTTLSTLVVEIDKLDWYSARQEGLGDLYEGLLEKNASETKSGAGQYFTARPLIDSMVAVLKPTLEDIIQDPAGGTLGFPIAASRYIRRHSDPDRWTAAQQHKYYANTFYAMEHVQDTHRLALMNLMLHGLESDPEGAGVRYGDTLSPEGQALPKATLIMTNPPFGTKKGGGLPTRTDFTFPTSNKQFAFLQHIYRGLLPNGRAGRGAARQRALRGERGPPDPGRPAGQVQSAHDPAAAHGHLLRPGGQDECPLLHAGDDGQGEHARGLGLRPAGQHAGLWQADAC